MKKKLEEVAPRSARTIAPPPAVVSPPEPTATGAVMSLADLPSGARSAHLEESLERAVLPAAQTEGGPAQRPRATPPEALPATVAPAASGVPTVPAQSAKPITKMIATPIDAILRQRVRELRGQYEISEAFVVETALRAFFANRTIDDVAADLRARGGRLRRNR